MITAAGKQYIKSYLAGIVPNIAQSLAVGVGSSAPADSNTRLQFEVARADITLTSFDFINDKLIFKAPVPEGLGGTLYEVGIFSSSSDTVAGQFGSKVLTSFDPSNEQWINPTTLAPAPYVTGTSRLGSESMRVAAPAGSSLSATAAELALDLSGHSGLDRFNFAFYVTNTYVSSISFRFLTDASNYYTLTINSPSAGYQAVELAKSTATVTGSPDWEKITEMRVIVNSSAGGSGIVDFDGIRIEDVDTINPNYVLVARDILAVPFVKQEGKVQEIEFSLDINI